MADSDSDEEKTEEPSQKRIDDLRNKGDVASSKELTSVLVLTASLLTMVLSLVYIYEVMSEFINWIYRLDTKLIYTPKYIKTITTNTMFAAFKCAAPVSLVALLVGIVSNVAQVGFLFSTEVLELKFDRINPVQGFKRLFSMKSMVEAIKGVLKFVFIIFIVYFYLKDDLDTFNGFYYLNFFDSFILGRWMIAKLGFAIVAGLAVIAVGDFAYQKISYKKKTMQTKDEAKRESKEQEGSPELKQKIRETQIAIANNKMMKDVPEADVIVTNPTHLSIAIKYDADKMRAPQIVAKGADHLALRIREIAKENDVLIVENVTLARTLYKTVKVGEGVPRNLYKVVSEVLAFVYKMKKRKI